MTTYALKDGVRHRSNEDAMIDARLVAFSVYAHHGYKLTKTSGFDSFEAHSRKSAHLYGRADDYRTRDIPAENLEERRRISRMLADEIRANLPVTFDVIFEQSSNPNNDHIHIEYDIERDDLIPGSSRRSVKHKHV